MCLSVSSLGEEAIWLWTRVFIEQRHTPCPIKTHLVVAFLLHSNRLCRLYQSQLKDHKAFKSLRVALHTEPMKRSNFFYKMRPSQK